MARRNERVGEVIRAELAELLRKETRDPRLQRLVSVTAVEVTPDLKLAHVHVSVLGDADDKREVLRTLAGAAGYLRSELAQRLDLRRTPELHFKLDESIERGTRILQLLKEAVPPPAPTSPTPLAGEGGRGKGSAEPGLTDGAPRPTPGKP